MFAQRLRCLLQGLQAGMVEKGGDVCQARDALRQASSKRPGCPIGYQWWHPTCSACPPDATSKIHSSDTAARTWKTLSLCKPWGPIALDGAWMLHPSRHVGGRHSFFSGLGLWLAEACMSPWSRPFYCVPCISPPSDFIRGWPSQLYANMAIGGGARQVICER